MATTTTPGVQLLQESDVPYEQVSPGLEIARPITAAGFTSLGGGWVRMDGSAELANWTLKYDEVVFCLSGELEIESNGSSTVAQPGQAGVGAGQDVGAVAPVLQQLAAAVASARCLGHSWSELGAALGVTRQAAQQRFGSTVSSLSRVVKPNRRSLHKTQGDTLCTGTRAGPPPTTFGQRIRTLLEAPGVEPGSATALIWGIYGRSPLSCLGPAVAAN